MEKNYKKLKCRYRLLCIILLSLTTLNVNAQEVIVNSFKENPFYTLNGEEVKKDLNGDTCALVMVCFDVKNATFEGSYVVEATANDNFYKVYLAGGASKLTIKHNDYLPLTINFIDFGTRNLKSSKVYRIELMGDNTKYSFNLSDAQKDYTKDVDSSDADIQYKMGKQFYLGINVEQDYELAFDYFSKAAKKGHMNALYNLGLCYYHGQGTTQDYDSAVVYLRKAAEMGHAMAQYKYANCYNFGFGTQGKNVSEAIKWYEMAAAQGVNLAKNNVAWLYLFHDPANSLAGLSITKSLGFPSNYEKGIRYFKECENEGIWESSMGLGRAYSNGIGVRQDEALAIKYYEKALDHGCYNALISLGYCYGEGKGVNKNAEKSFEFYNTAAEKGLAEGAYSVALYYTLGKGVKKDYSKAISYYQKAAEQNYANAETNLGYLYEKGLGVNADRKKALDYYLEAGKDGDPNGYAMAGTMYYTTKNFSKAFEYFSKAADAGNVNAIMNLGIMYENGEYVERNGRTAISYFERVLQNEQVNHIANFNLGYLYYEGCFGVAKDYRMAYKYFEKSAEKGFANAQYYVGYMLMTGQSVTKDVRKGLEYLKKSARQGFSPAQQVLQQCGQSW